MRLRSGVLEKTHLLTVEAGLGDASLGQGECGSGDLNALSGPGNAWLRDPGQAGQQSPELWALSAASPGWSWAKGPQKGPGGTNQGHQPQQPQ